MNEANPCRFCGDVHEIQKFEVGAMKFTTCPSVPSHLFGIGLDLSNVQDFVSGPNKFKGSWVPMAAEPQPPKHAPPDVDVCGLADELLRRAGAANKARGILKHGPYGSGMPGDCDTDCAKCAAQPVNHELTNSPSIYSDRDEVALRSYVAIQRENTAVRKLTAEERDVASAAWSAQLRLKVEARRKADAEAARHTPYWNPEEQSGDDL